MDDTEDGLGPDGIRQIPPERLAAGEDFFALFHQTTLELLRRRDLDELLEQIVLGAARILDVEMAEIALLDGDDLVIRAVTESQPEMRHDRIDRGSARVAWRAIDTGRPAIVDDYGVWPHRRAVYGDLSLGPVADLPILRRGRSIGIIGLSRRSGSRGFSDADIRRGMAFTQLVALALDNAALHREALREIEHRRQLAERLAIAIEGAYLGLWDWDVAAGHVDVGEHWSAMLGYAAGELPERIVDWEDHVHPDDLGAVRGARAAHLSGANARYESEHRMRHRSGRFVWVLDVGRLIAHDGQTRVVGVMQDITARKSLEFKLTEMATTDPLTGTANRRALLDALDRERERFLRHGQPAAFLMLDLDHFKAVNDRHGHLIGDRVLRHLTALIGKRLRRSDTLGRFGGEEFGILLPGTGSEGAVCFAEDLRRAIAAHPVDVPAGPIAPTVSIGVTILMASDTSVDDIVARADAALYRAKAAGRDRVECRSD